MRAFLPLPALLLLPSLWQFDAPTTSDSQSDPSPGDELALVRAGCTACHEPPAALAGRLDPLPAPAFETLGAERTSDALEARIRGHYTGGGRADQVRAIASFLRDTNGRELDAAEVSPGLVERGALLFDELACAACHDGGLDGLAASTDHRAMTDFLIDAGRARPDLDHDFGLEPREARALAAHLLRETVQTGVPGPGFRVECFELRIRDGSEPDLGGLEPSFRGTVTGIDVAPRTRDDHFALRFTTSLRVERAGRHRFEVGSDDGSWLYLDEKLVVANEGLHPYSRVRGAVELEPGEHDLRLVYTEAGGDEELSLRWAPPGEDFDDVPADRTRSRADRLVPPEELPLMDIGILARGEAAYDSFGCAACHGRPRSAPAAPALVDLDASADCSVTEVDAAVRRLLAGLPAGPRTQPEDLEHELGRARCLACHDRDGRGGLTRDVARALTETQDLGEEGRQPPSLTGAGFRFQTEWIRSVLADRADARPYLRARCVSLPRDRAERLASALAAVDSESGDDIEPVFSAEALELGRQQVGVGGKVCVSCHRVQGRDSLGPQGMDLARQSERLKPAWFRQWLRRPHELRPGTRMPPFWIAADDETARREIEAIRVWTNFGAAAPLPDGLAIDTAGTVVDVGDRTRLHAAFLDGLSARGLLVGTPERVHYAYDLEQGRLRWLWRGAFVDGRGTWDGRAGKLVRPLGDDWIVLPSDHGPMVASGETLRVVARRLDSRGDPTFVLAVGDARIEDSLRPTFEADGPVLVRTLRVTRGQAGFDLVDGDDYTVRLRDGEVVGSDRRLMAGEALEVIYRW